MPLATPAAVRADVRLFNTYIAISTRGPLATPAAARAEMRLFYTYIAISTRAAGNSSGSKGRSEAV